MKKPQTGKKTASIISLSDRYVLPTYGRLPHCFVKGRGSFLWDAEGKKYLDMVAGIAVNNLGHSHPRLIKTLTTQAKKIFHTSNLFYIEPQARLAQKLVEFSGLHQAFFCNSGAEAMEACIKFARHWGITQKGEKCYTILVFENSFHGRTLGALSATAQKKYQEGFGPLVPGFKVLPLDDRETVARALDETVCGIMIEPVQAEGGVNIPHQEFLQFLRTICDEKNLLLILDEVQVGIGRTGKVFAYLHDGIKPDLIGLAKGLGAGYPIGACLASEKVAKTVHPGMHASTFGGSQMASTVALEVLKIVSQKSFLKSVVEKGIFFQKLLRELQNKYPLIKEVRGRGLMVACELAQERGGEIVKACLDRGLIINAIRNKVLRFVPPLMITKKEIRQGVKILEEVLKENEE